MFLNFREQIRQGLEELQKVLPGGDTYMHEGFERVILFVCVCVLLVFVFHILFYFYVGTMFFNITNNKILSV